MRWSGNYILDAASNGKENGSEPSGQVLPQWVESPFRLWSWLDMNKFSAQEFVKIGGGLEWFAGLFKKGEWDENTKGMAERMCFELENDLKAIGCELSRKAAHRLGFDVHISGVVHELSDFKLRFEELRDVMVDEMGMHLFLWVPSHRARFYELPEDLTDWNETEIAIEELISLFFKRAGTEILRARKAYAVGEFTPCVFHLMRACEVGIKALYKSLGLSAPALSDSWGNMLKPMDTQIALKPSERYGDWATHSEFFDHATNDVRAIKRAWRDATMHVDSDYNESQALKALDAVTSFFGHLSEHLNQDGVTH
jgi:hypothetical protein